MLRRTLEVPGGLIAVRDSRSERFPNLGRSDRVKATRSVTLIAVQLEGQGSVSVTLTTDPADVADQPALVELWTGSVRVPSGTLTVETVTGVLARITHAPEVQVTVLTPRDDLVDEMRLREVVILAVSVGARHGRQLEWSPANGGGGYQPVQTEEAELVVLAPHRSTELAAIRGRWPWGLAYVYDPDATPEEWPDVDDGSASAWPAHSAIAVRVMHEQHGEAVVRLHLDAVEQPAGSVCVFEGEIAVSAGEVRIGDATQAVSSAARVPSGTYFVRVLVDAVDAPQRVDVLLATTAAA